MKLGLLSDTHGRLPMTRRAVDSLVGLGVQHVLHLGDIGDGHAPFDGLAVLDCLAEFPARGIPCHLVAGNNDHNESELRSHARHLGLTLVEQGHILAFGSIRVGLTHGHKHLPMAALEDAGVELICSGHTHEYHVTSLQGPGGQNILWVNPGALFRTRFPSVATVDLPDLRVSQYTV
jgi:uncharacterized protein